MKTFTKKGFFFIIKGEKSGSMKNKIIIISSVIAVLLLGIGLYVYVFTPQIDLKGKKNISLNYKDKYEEKGYTAKYLGKDMTKKVKVKGKVNSNKLGTYEIVYSIQNGLLSKTVVRRVSVKDLKKPKLSIDDSDISICPGSDVVPEKVTATDNYDGDLTDKVKVIINKQKTGITYQVTDSSGNMRRVTKKILYEDKEAPKIILNGQENTYIYVGEEYKDAGATVEDNCDSNLGKELKVKNNVNSGAVGDYEVIYQVADKSDNEAKVVRKVRVSEKSKNGSVYLTFDDGPQSGTTDVILDILKEEGVKATFFVTNVGPDELIKRAYEEGHTVALHTATHNYAVLYASDEAFFQDLNGVSERVKRITGEESKIIRFPGGSSNTISRKYNQGIMSRLTKEVLNRGYKYYDWNISSGDAGNTKDPNQVYLNVVNNLSKDRMNMVLMHDIKPYTRDALRRIIQYGKQNGYHFERITMSTEMITQRVNN